ncbi:glycosyltransferase family 4 protein [Humibacter sp. RRB41]|uniref:glycosyltransferase family 4 protein n=1 Tax=Humibacter sp. RRB41 TaxID=2919946 RepID=UPI001FA95EAF|nr:glycosyltransferase family 4 protein [Humibacter sp. RRB41]
MSDTRDSAPRIVHVVVPEGVDDPLRVSGGNVYDLALCRGLTDLGWDVRMLRSASGGFATTAVLSRLPDGAVVVIDGLLAVEAPDALERESGRLRMVVLAHMVAASVAPEHERAAAADRERRALDAAAGVVVTSRWTRDELVSEGLSHPDRIVVALPGVERVPATVASPGGTRLLCVGAVAPHKGQDVLLRALAGLDDRQNWTCTLAGSLDVDPDFVAALMTVAEAAGLGERIRFAGVLMGSRLADAYAAADLLVAPSRAESFGMAVAEALAHGIPVLASRVGGLPEAVDGSGAGILVPPDDPWALRVVLQQWWSDAGRRSALKAEAMRTRCSAPGWHETAESIATVLSDVASGHAVHASSRRRA